MRSRRKPPAAPGSPEAGFSLVEGLMAAALLLIVAVSILPLFYRALESNLFGGRRSQLATFASGDLEALNQQPVDQSAWSVSAAPGGVLDLGTSFWEDLTQTNPETLGDERWDAPWTVGNTPTAGPGVLTLWRSDAEVRKYALADVQILVGAGGGVVTGGAHPMLFDNPLTDDDGAHFTELRVTIKEMRDALPAASGKRITVGQLRAF